MKIESTIRQVNAPQQAVYNKLSDLQNLGKLKDKLPEDKVKDLSFDADGLSLKTPVGNLRVTVVEREEPKLVKLQTQQSPVPLTLWIQMLPVTDVTSKMKLTVNADVSPIIGGMIKKQLQEGLEKMADALQLIPYED